MSCPLQISKLIDDITLLDIERSEVIDTIVEKLRLVTILPPHPLGQLQVNKSLLDDILHENALLTRKVKILKETLNVQKEPKSTPQRRDTKKEKMDRIPVALLPTSIEKTYNYRDTNSDGSPKPLTKKQLDLHNFRLLFRAFLDNIALPDIVTHGPMLHWKLVPFTPISIASLSGPEDSSAVDQSYSNLASGGVISLYPHCKGRPTREGDPICDRYTLKLYPHNAIICVTDGCNWGGKPRRAARIANKAMVQYVEKHISTAGTVWDAIQVLVASMVDAQLSIIDGPEEIWLGGKTTANIGVLLDIDQKWVEEKALDEVQDIMSEDFVKTIIPTRWAFVSVNIGDCKVLHFSKTRRTVHDLTEVSRSDMLDPTDPGGRLGPYHDLWPDFRNLASFWSIVEEGDFIASMSDGVHDNLDPQIQGFSPADFGLGEGEWDSLDPRTILQLKTLYLRYFTEFLFHDVEVLSPQVIKDIMLAHCTKNTKIAREFLENFPQNKTPPSYKEYPGKLDHTSIVCFRVGEMDDKQHLQKIPAPEPEELHINFANIPDVTSLSDMKGVIERVKLGLAAAGAAPFDPQTLKLVSCVKEPKKKGISTSAWIKIKAQKLPKMQ